MRRIILLLPLTAIAVLLLASGILVAQEQSLPDLTVQKSGPKVITAGEFVTYTIVVTNVGSGNAIIPPGNGDIQTSPTLWEDVARFPAPTVTVVGCDTSSPYGRASLAGRARFKCEAGHVERDQQDVIPPGATRPGQVFLQTAKLGIILDCATVDPDNVVAESNEKNNTQCLTTKVKPKKAR